MSLCSNYDDKDSSSLKLHSGEPSCQHIVKFSHVAKPFNWQ